MKLNTLILSLLLNIVLVYSKSKSKSEINAKSFAISSSPLCDTDKTDKSQRLYYASIPSELMKDKVNCNNYLVAMNADSNSKGKYRLVKTFVRDECKDCGPYGIKLSIKALSDISGSRKANVFWAVLSKEGELLGGPFKPTLSKTETKNLLKVSGEKNIVGVLKQFAEKAKEMIKNENLHEKELPWEKKNTTVKSNVKHVKSTVIKKTVVVTDHKKVIVYKTKSSTKTAAPTGTPIPIPVEAPIQEDENENEESSSGSGVLTGTVAVSVAAGATLLLIRRRSNKKNYIFGEPIDKYDGKTAKELYAKTKDGQKLKIQIPYNDFNDIAHIQIFSPNGKDALPNIDVYNVHTERAMVSDTISYDSISLPLPQEQPQPHSQLPVPSNNDFMMAFSPVLQPDLVALPKENIGSYDCTKITTRISDDPYLNEYKGNDDQEIYNSVPKEMNQTNTEKVYESSTDILLEYVDGEDFY